VVAGNTEQPRRRIFYGSELLPTPKRIVKNVLQEVFRKLSVANHLDEELAD